MNKLNIVSVLALAFAAALVAGCGPKLPYKVVPLEGTITCDGEPVRNCSFFFMPDEGRSSAGASDQDGHFIMAYTSDVAGVQVGKGHFYFIAGSGLAQSGEDGVSVSALATKYPRGNDKLVYTIEKEDKNFELKLSLND